MLPNLLVVVLFKGSKFPLMLICVPLIFVKVHVPDESILLEVIEASANLEPLILAPLDISESIIRFTKLVTFKSVIYALLQDLVLEPNSESVEGIIFPLTLIFSFMFIEPLISIPIFVLQLLLTLLYNNEA